MRQISLRLSSLVPVALLATGILAVACSASRRENVFGAGDGDAGFEGGTGFTPGVTPCEGLECKQIKCDDEGDTTTLTGTVYDPAGANPLYNVMVYIPGGTDPDGDLPPFKDSTEEGIACETCAGLVVNPLVSTLTDGNGEFALKNVPVDKDVPLVIQVGKWRRKFHVDITKKCRENKVPESEIRLPKNGSEGDMPQIAVTSGEYDALECLLRGIGIDDDEFVMGHAGSGHVHVFQGYGGGMGDPAEDFWNDAEQLKKYDLVLLSCEGNVYHENKGGDAPGARGSMFDYLNAGGRVFATHYHYTWFKDSPATEFQSIATFDYGPGSGPTYDVNMSFPKGKMLAEWLRSVGASTTLGKVPLKSPAFSVSAVSPNATSWIQTKEGTPKYFTFNTPVGAEPADQCGRAVFSDLHITDKAGPSSISACGISAGGLNPQQAALEFLFFDLSACISDDRTPPEPPK